MVGRLAELPEATQSTLRLAACIGNKFDLATLGVVTTDAANTVIANITPAIDAGLIVVDHGPSRPEPTRQSTMAVSQLRFLHDRVQQAAYSLIDESLRSQAHLKIGRRLVSSLEAVARDRRLFEIVDHLNAGRELVSDDVESRQLAELNLRAASKAIAATAYVAARDYAVAGLTWLPESRWGLDYELTKDLHRLEAEAEYLRGDFERSQEIVDAIFLELRTPVERAELHNTLIIQRTLSSQYPEAIETGRKGLALLGVDLPEDKLEQELERELTLYRDAICRREPSDLLEVSEMSSREMRVAMQLLASLCPLCYIAHPQLCRVVSAKMVNLSLIHGHTPDSAFGYAFFGQMHSSVLHEYDAAYKFGQLAMALADKLEDSTQTCRTSHVFCAFINHWTRPLREFDAVNTRGFQAGLQSGEVQFAGYHRYNRALCLFHQGTDLRELLPQTEEWIRFGTRTRNQHVTDQITALRGVVLDLAGETPEPAGFAADTSSEMSFVEDLETRYARPALCHYNIIKSQAYYLYNRIEEALRCAEEATKHLPFISGHVSVAVHNFYESLILAAAAAIENRPELVDRVKHNQLQMREWAASCPDNFLHKCLLVDAELAQLDGNDWQAAELYDRAIIEASRNGYRQEEALARERAGLFWLAKGFRKIAALYLREAHHGYQLWGASRKAQLLGEQYVDLLAAAPVAASAVSSSTRDNSLPFFTLVSSSGAALDFATVMKASRALSGEIDLDSLLKRLMRIAVETAGAQTGQLLLSREDGLYVEATTDLENGQTRSSPIPVASSKDVPPTIVNYVTRTQETLNVADAAADPRFAGDSVIQRLRPRSILCLPIMMRTETFGLLYLAHNLASNAFTSDRVQILQSLAAQAAISLQNARLYQERRENEHELRETLAEVQQLKNRLEAENLYFREEIELQHGFEEIVGRSPGVKKLLHAVETVAPTDATVLILGETGTGKELVARAIHNLSACKEQPLITVNCAALPAGLVESELFGHEKGAFTGAVSHKTGRFELADRGTIFLDEIGELPVDLQTKLLRVLQEGEFERVGGQQTIRVNVRVIAATNRDLIKTMQNGSFREDLYYRLSVFPLHIPPLRERGGDIPLLVQHFVQKHSAKLAKNVETIPQRRMDALKNYHWPGNVRELENVIERAMILSQGSELQLGDWAAGVGASPEPVDHGTLQDVEKEHILKVLRRTNWQLGGEKGAARILGLKRTTLQGRMRKLEIRREP
jgi:Nif-specific regulatory protein